MSPAKEIYSEERGAALIIALAVVSIMMIIGVTVISSAINSEMTVGHDKRVTMSQNVAEAGIEDAIQTTVTNYEDVFPTGVIPSGAGNGTAVFSQYQSLTGSSGAEIGTYQVWVKQDPERSGNMLFTAVGYVGNNDVTTVKVSAKINLQLFNYAIFVGDPDADYSDYWHHHHHHHDYNRKAELEFDRSSDGGGAIEVYGKVHVNGDLELRSGSSYWGHDWGGYNKGTIAFYDTVTYTDDYDRNGYTPIGSVPTEADRITFPVIDFNAPSITTGAITLTFGSTTPAGWSRSGWSDNYNYSISAVNFQSRYAGKVVRFNNQKRDSSFKITNAGSPLTTVTITSTIVLPPKEGSVASIRKLEIQGPNLNLRPTNGLALLTGQGRVELENGVNVGYLGGGALIYCVNPQGSYHRTEFEVEDGGTIYGSVVIGALEAEFETGGYSDHHGRNVKVVYDGSFQSKVGRDWWDGGSDTVIKENFTVTPS